MFKSKGFISAVVGFGVVILFFVMPLMGKYNNLVESQSNVDVQWAKVESKLQRRYDLIPNLVNSVQGVMDQEQEVFGAIADARSKIGKATTTDESIDANEQMDSAVMSLIMITENYPELKSNENVQSLMTELAGTENRISVERDRYNEEVQGYNNKVKKFPGSLVANMFGFDEYKYYEADAQASVAPTVNFND